jgi:D-xylonolactonase
MAFELEIIAQDNNLCGEGPIWDAAKGRMLWNDIESSLVYQLDLASSEKTIISHDLNVAGIALDQSGNLIFAGATGLHLWHRQDAYQTLVSEYEGETLAFNDILADPKGRIYAGTVYWGAQGMEKLGKLYCIDPDGVVHGVDEGIQLSNGLGLDPDNRTLYYADSAARRIYAYDIDPEIGALTNKRVFVQVPGDEGIPDGLTVDAEGFVWSAQWYGSQVVRYDPDGKVERRIKMPVKQVSSVAFGGPDLTDLYITTAGAPWPSDLTPPGYEHSGEIGGSFYRLHLEDVQGKEEHRADLSGFKLK